MKILLLGATGQIGFALASRLAGSGHRLRALVRDRGKLPFPPEVELLAAPQFTQDVFGQALEGVDLVVYSLGLPEQFTLGRRTFERVNYGLFAEFLGALARHPVARLVYVSTYEVFESVHGEIRETHPVSDASRMTPYFRAMNRAYRLVCRFAHEQGVGLTSIHPAAVYGGLDTGDGLTAYLEKLLRRQRLRIPVIVNGRFPVVHVDSLAEGIVRSFSHSGAFIVSDQMTSLGQIAVELGQLSRGRSLTPPTVPLWLARSGATLLEAGAKVLRDRPLVARVQLDFVANGAQPFSEKAQRELFWQPLPLAEGLTRYLSAREAIPPVVDRPPL